jgi:hypothetical protein
MACVKAPVFTLLDLNEHTEAQAAEVQRTLDRDPLPKLFRQVSLLLAHQIPLGSIDADAEQTGKMISSKKRLRVAGCAAAQARRNIWRSGEIHGRFFIASLVRSETFWRTVGLFMTTLIRSECAARFSGVQGALREIEDTAFSLRSLQASDRAPPLEPSRAGQSE